MTVSFIAQELQIPFTCWSSSEPNADYREFHYLNHQRNIIHQHVSLAEQLAGRPCSRHEHSCDSCRVADCPDLLVIGAPCNPFSGMRCDRFAAGSVEQHQSFSLTFDGVTDVLQQWAPATAIMETTYGFCQPIEKSSARTPLTELPARSLASDLIT